MGGTFNPIHIGHLEVASRVLKIFNLKKVIFIPTGNPPHKNASEIISAEHRLNMIKLAIAGREGFEVSDMEIKRKGKSYTLDTIKQIEKSYGNDADIYFIAGVDSVLDLPNWRNPLEILSAVHFIAVERPKFSLSKLEEGYRKKITAVEGISIDISSSDIRNRIKEGKDVKKLIPESVEKYIRNNGLYI